MSGVVQELKDRLGDVNALNAALAILDWDQQTFMPPGGAHARAEHVGRLSKLAHEMFTDDETARLVEDASRAAEGVDVDMVRVVRRDLELATKLPTDLVSERARLSAIAHEEWVSARARNDFKTFAPTLSRMFEIAREVAEHLGYTDHPYDALLDQYEEGATAAEARAMFDAIKRPQVDLVRQIQNQPPIDDSPLYGEWDKEKQRRFTEMLVTSIGFDFERGRQDTAPHPFCTGWSRGDIRLTTRYLPYVGSAIFGSMHEAGHGMYEQGTPPEWDLSPLAGGVSLGIHESQSRLWENIIGRSQPFWRRYLPALQSEFPTLSAYGPDLFYRMINRVKPSFIRVEADELTYNLHVLVRFELECALLTGEIAVADLPQAWNAKYKDYLGIEPETDTEGCLQDVHWSMGSIGYFPTYTMGNLLSYQFWASLKKDIPNTEDLVEKGEFMPILSWLQEKIYRRGRQLKPKDLVLHVTGKPIDPSDYLEGLGNKYKAIYGL